MELNDALSRCRRIRLVEYEAEILLEMAKERAFCDGPPYCYKKALDEAEENIKKINSKS